jgi:hypothetical protein
MLTAVLIDHLRAHESGAFELVRGVWTPCGNGFTVSLVERMETAVKTALIILFRATGIDEGINNGDISQKVAATRNGIDFQTDFNSLLRDAARFVREADESDWRTSTMKSLLTFVPVWSRCDQIIYKEYCRWAFTPRPSMNGVVAFNDVIIELGDNNVKQLQAASARDCYVFIPESLAYRPSDDFILWFKRFFTTTMAGDMDAMELEFSIESLSSLGKRLPHHIIVYFGEGGNSKGARSRLRARAFADGHRWVSPTVFDKAVKDEFRKQGHEFYGAMMCTIREADNFDFDEKIFRAWTAGEGIGCRLPHAVHTPMLEWPCTGKFWEMNVHKTPKIASIGERSMSRRFIGIEKTATSHLPRELQFKSIV